MKEIISCLPDFIQELNIIAEFSNSFFTFFTRISRRTNKCDICEGDMEQFIDLVIFTFLVQLQSLVFTPISTLSLWNYELHRSETMEFFFIITIIWIKERGIPNADEVKRVWVAYGIFSVFIPRSILIDELILMYEIHNIEKQL